MRLVAYLCVVVVASTVAAAANTLRVLDCTLASTSLGDCNYFTYGVRSGAWAVPGVLFTVGFMLCCPFYCGAKYCCNCCGGRTQAPNFCCANRKYPARYTRFDIVRARVVAGILALLASICAAWCFAQMFSLIAAVNAALAGASGTGDTLTSAITNIESDLTIQLFRASTNTWYFRNFFESTGAREAAIDIVARVDALTQSAAGQATPYIAIAAVSCKAYFGSVMGVLLLAVALPGVGLRRVVSMAVVWFVFLLIMPTWILHGVFSTAAVVSGEVCAEVAGVNKGEQTVASNLVGCADSWFDSFRTKIRDLETDQTRASCVSLAGLCYSDQKSLESNIAVGAIYNCSAADASCATMASSTELAGIVSRMFVTEVVALSVNASSRGLTCRGNALSCSLQLCATNCTMPLNQLFVLSPTGRNAKEVLSNVEGATTIMNVADSSAAEYGSCDNIAQALVGNLDAPCASLASAFISVRTGTGLLALSLTGVIVTFAWGAKRFLPIAQGGKILDDNQGPKKATE